MFNWWALIVYVVYFGFMFGWIVLATKANFTLITFILATCTYLLCLYTGFRYLKVLKFFI